MAARLDGNRRMSVIVVTLDLNEFVNTVVA